jgi:hypothetical protein
MTWRRVGDYLNQARKQQLAESEERVREGMAPLVQAATDADEDRRQAAVHYVRQKWPPAVLRVLVERLAEMLGRGTESAHRAGTSLIQLGASTLPVLTHKFMQARSAAVQQHTLEVLAGIGRRLNPADRSELMMELVILVRYAVEEAVRQQAMEVVTTLRRANESRRPTGARGRGGEAEDAAQVR